MQALKHFMAHAPSPQVPERCAPPKQGNQPGKNRRLYVSSMEEGGMGLGQREGRVTQEDSSDGSWQEPGNNQETLKWPQDCRGVPGEEVKNPKQVGMYRRVLETGRRPGLQSARVHRELKQATVINSR